MTFDKIEVYQDNGGGLSMFLLNGDGCAAYAFSMERPGPGDADGYLRRLMVEIAEDTDTVDIDEDGGIDAANHGWAAADADKVLDEFRGAPETDLIASMDIRDMELTVRYGRMGANGRIAFGA